MKKSLLFDRFPAGNYIIMLMIAVIFAIQFLGDPASIYLNKLVLTPRNLSFNAFLGYSWLHTGPAHITVNLLTLAICGRIACVKIGTAKYILIYAGLGYAAAFAHVLFDARPVIGASGAIWGVMGMAVALSYRKLSPLGPWLILIWVATSVAAAVAGGTPDAHIAHIGGFIAGMLVAIVLVVCNLADGSDIDHSLKRIILPLFVKN